ncbi:hypothetical protein [Aureimonas jatrophae]|nr:hypothetical protein [Aureimonas jatrophae]
MTDLGTPRQQRPPYLIAIRKAAGRVSTRCGLCAPPLTHLEADMASASGAAQIRPYRDIRPGEDWVIEIDGTRFPVNIGSDIEDDGMYLEVANEAGALLLLIFYDDRTAEMSVTTYRPALSLALIEQAILIARIRLPPDPKRG